MTEHESEPAARLEGVGKVFRRGKSVTRAIDDISFSVARGALTALVGPDGAGKTTLLRLLAGLVRPDSGKAYVAGLDVAARSEDVRRHIAYMPQRFGLYGDLTVRENLDLYADLCAADPAAWPRRRDELLQAAGLAAFAGRRAGQLSGGMKQKLSLACALVRSPDLLLLDEPTVGVDPLSRRELWTIIDHFVSTDRLSVLVATSYMDEAARSDLAVILHKGKILQKDAPAELIQTVQGMSFMVSPGEHEPARLLQARLLDTPGIIDAVPQNGAVRFIRSSDAALPPALNGLRVEPVPPDFSDAFSVALGNGEALMAAVPSSSAPNAARPSVRDGTVVEVKNLTRKFGDFIAVDDVSFSVRRGEIFGLLGPNGAGKTTTFRMLCGLLPASSGTLRVEGVDLRTAPATARARIGYVPQAFSLYGQLTVAANLAFYAGAYGLTGTRKRDRIHDVTEEFGLEPFAGTNAGVLPGGFDKRLAMACALLHEPGLLFLDEPSSGADLMTRREFWKRITALAGSGVTVIVTTHFMEEAEFCDRVLIQDSGRVLALGTPAELRERAPKPMDGGAPTMEDAFIAIVEQARAEHGEQARAAGAAA